MDKLYKFVRAGWPFIGPFVTILALGGVFNLTPHNLQSAAAYVWPKISTVPLGWLFLAVFACYFTFQSLRYRSVVLTLIRHDIDFHINEPDGKDVRVIHKQEIRPHRENITGYLRKVQVSGRMPKDRITMDISHATTQDKQFEGTPSQWEFIHTFESEPIPVNPLRLGFDRAVTRQEQYVALDSYTEPEQWHEIKISSEYRCRRLTMRVHFHKDRPLEAHLCSAIRINASGVTRIRVDPILGDPGAVALEIRNPRVDERYRLIWKRIPNWQPPASSPVQARPQSTEEPGSDA